MCESAGAGMAARFGVESGVKALALEVFMAVVVALVRRWR